MTTLDALARWRSTGAITGGQHAALAAIVSKERFSLFLELNALLYVGVVALVAGLGWTVREHFASLGDAAVVVPLAAIFGACLYYCVHRAPPYSPDRVESPTLAFDYILYLGCLVFGVELGYVEFRFHLLQERWDYYLLASAAIYLVLAYRFDNRFVLSLALSALAGWFGFRFTAIGMHIGSLRGDALVYSGVVAGGGWWLRHADVKAHFLETYLHIAANAGLAALLSGALDGENRELWLLALIVAVGVAISQGVRVRRFAFVTYGVLYGYVGVSAEIIRGLRDATPILAYLVISAIGVVALLVVLARTFGRDA
jgi:hypothetical protein